MNRTTRWIIAGVVTVAVAGTAGGIAVAGGGDNPAPLTGAKYDKAAAAALAHTGSGRVTETEDGDEDSRYEVEVTLPNGDVVDVQLDENFKVVGEKNEGPETSEDDSDNER